MFVNIKIISETFQLAQRQVNFAMQMINSKNRFYQTLDFVFGNGSFGGGGAGGKY